MVQEQPVQRPQGFLTKMESMNSKIIGLIVFSLAISYLMIGRIVQVMTYDVEGMIVHAKRDCTSQSRCFAEYKIKTEGKNDLITIIEGAGDGFWSEHLIAGDVLLKRKYNTEFCTNGECRKESLLYEYIMLLLAFLIFGYAALGLNNKSKK